MAGEQESDRRHRISIFPERQERINDARRANRELLKRMKGEGLPPDAPETESEDMRRDLEDFLAVRESDPDFKKELQEEMNRLMMGLPPSEARKSLVKSLVKIANDLDNRGLAQESDIIDSIISSCL